jgi:hypothetical protein
MEHNCNQFHHYHDIFAARLSKPESLLSQDSIVMIHCDQIGEPENSWNIEFRSLDLKER